MKPIWRITAIAWVGIAAAGCTMRYSQTITGTIRKMNTTKIVNADSGTEVGLDISVSKQIANGIAFKEPKGAAELADYPCDAEFVEVDYRSRWYAYYIRVDFPEVAVTTYCVED